MKSLFFEDGMFYEKIALVENGKLQDLHISKKDDSPKKGDIYLGRVVNILNGMDSAFVDIGSSQNGYIHIKDIDGRADKGSKINVNISDLLKRGKEYVVQVLKEPAGGKGPKLTMKPSLPGKYSVLLIEDQSIAVSKKIDDPDIRNQYHRAAKDFLEGLPYGVIIRTECVNASIEEFLEDLRGLISKWSLLTKGVSIRKPPCALYSGENLYELLKKDFIREDLDNIYCTKDDDEKILSQIVADLGDGYNPNIINYKENVTILRDFAIESQILASLDKKVNMESGGFLYIEETEAMTIIDVNSGKFTGEYDTEKTFLELNRSAAKEIARQLRIRNIGGIVLIDFIDMKKKSSRDKILSTLKREFRNDRNGCNVLGFTKLGFLEMTRKKQALTLSEIMSEECKGCLGSGKILSVDYMINHLEQEVKRIVRESDKRTITFKVSRYFMDNFDKKSLEKISSKHGIKIDFLIEEKYEDIPKIKFLA